MKKQKPTQTVIDENYEKQFVEVDYTRQLGALDALAKKAEKLRKTIAIRYAEGTDENLGNREMLDILERNLMHSYREAKQAYFNAIALMGFCAHQISYIKSNGHADYATTKPDTSVEEIKQCLDILGEIYG